MVHKLPKELQTPAGFVRTWGRSVASIPAEVIAATTLCVCCMTLTGLLLRSYTHQWALRPRRYSPSGVDLWVASLYPETFQGFFLDFGALTDWSTSSTRLLEDRGWQGICFDPFPRLFESRTCGIITQAIGGLMSQLVTLPNCTGEEQDSPEHGLQAVREEDCPSLSSQTYGISRILSLVEAPPVIDYIALGVSATSAQILEHFPWNRFCVRSWSVRVSPSARRVVRRSFLDHGCRFSEGPTETWVVCTCEASESPPPASELSDASSANDHSEPQALILAEVGRRPAPHRHGAKRGEASPMQEQEWEDGDVEVMPVASAHHRGGTSHGRLPPPKQRRATDSHHRRNPGARLFAGIARERPGAAGDRRNRTSKNRRATTVHQ